METLLGLNVEIASFLFAVFRPILRHRRVRGHGLELEVRGEPKNRYPDFTTIQEEHIQRLKQRNTIFLFIATGPVMMDATLKYWIFNYLTRKLPSAVAVYRTLNE